MITPSIFRHYAAKAEQHERRASETLAACVIRYYLCIRPHLCDMGKLLQEHLVR